MQLFDYRTKEGHRRGWEMSRKLWGLAEVSATAGRATVSTKDCLVQAVDGALLFCRSRHGDDRSAKAFVFDTAEREILHTMSWGEMYDRYFAAAINAKRLAKAEAEAAKLEKKIAALRG